MHTRTVETLTGQTFPASMQHGTAPSAPAAVAVATSFYPATYTAYPDLQASFEQKHHPSPPYVSFVDATAVVGLAPRSLPPLSQLLPAKEPATHHLVETHAAPLPTTTHPLQYPSIVQYCPVPSSVELNTIRPATYYAPAGSMWGDGLSQEQHLVSAPPVPAPGSNHVLTEQFDPPTQPHLPSPPPTCHDTWGRSTQKTFSFVSISGVSQKKRPRRKFDQVERLYHCNYEGCDKAYGTLNHLNAHVSMQKHGPKRHPSEFKKLRKLWRNKKRVKAFELSSTTPAEQH